MLSNSHPGSKVYKLTKDKNMRKSWLNSFKVSDYTKNAKADYSEYVKQQYMRKHKVGKVFYGAKSPRKSNNGSPRKNDNDSPRKSMKGSPRKSTKGSPRKKKLAKDFAFINADHKEDSSNYLSISIAMDEIEPEFQKYSIKAFKDVDFWFNKGYESSKLNHVDAAIDFYKNGLRIDSSNPIFYYNWGWLFNQINQCKKASEWFTRVGDILETLLPSEIEEIKDHEILTIYFLYYIAILNYRIQNFKHAITIIDEVILKLRTIMNLPLPEQRFGTIDREKYDIPVIPGIKSHPLHSSCYYLYALCYKQLKDYKNSNKYYKKFLEIAIKNKRRELTKYIWGLVLLPILDEKKEIINFVDNVKDIVEFYGYKDDPHSINTFYDFRLKDWKADHIDEAVDFFHKWFFFSRFSKHDLVAIINAIKLEQYNQNDVLFTDNSLYVILNGEVLLYDVINLRATYKQGDIIGSKYDSWETLKTESWWISRNKTIVAKMSRQKFDILWKKQRSNKKSLFMPYLQWNTLLKSVSDQTINLLCECMERRVYKAGSLISAQSKRSILNFDYSIFFVSKDKKKTKKLLEEQQLKNEAKEEIKSLLVKAMEHFKTKLTHNIDVEFAHDDPKLWVMTSNLDTPKAYWPSVKSYDTPWEGVFIINKGSWEVINRKDNYTVAFLFKGDYFGESEVIKIPDYTYFGDIYACPHQDVDIIMLSYEAMKRIPFFELQTISDENKKRFNSIFYTLATRYKIDINEIKMF